ncbi:MAG TPA: branched-chain amino acid ABC transporter permease [Acidimicrobiales bacterium]|nr:branched-chain amino acid ABC transporter permease [Acidimicrobiales bacterium]
MLPGGDLLAPLRERLFRPVAAGAARAAAGGSAGSERPGPGRTWPQWARLAGFLVVAALVPLVISGAYQLGVATLVLVYVVVSLGFYLVFCLTGQFAFSQAAMFGLGAYVGAWADRFTGFWLSLVVAVAITAAVAALFLLLVRRASELYFAIATLGFAEVAILVFQNWTAFTGSGGEVQLTAGIAVFGAVVDTPAGQFWLALGFAGVALILVKLVELSPMRREAIAVRDHERVALGMGVNTLRVRVVMFALGSAFAAAAGSLFATTQGFVDPDSFAVSLGIDIFLIVILGGVGSMWGTVVGSVFVVALPEIARPAAIYSDLIFSCCLLVVIFLLPQGFGGILHQARTALAVRRGAAGSAATATAAGTAGLASTAGTTGTAGTEEAR